MKICIVIHYVLRSKSLCALSILFDLSTHLIRLLVDLAILQGLQHQQRFIMKQENSVPVQESVIDNVTTLTLIRCTSMCMWNRDCVSFGYNAQERICILANSSIGTTSAGDGFRHYVSH